MIEEAKLVRSIKKTSGTIQANFTKESLIKSISTKFGLTAANKVANCKDIDFLSSKENALLIYTASNYNYLSYMPSAWWNGANTKSELLDSYKNDMTNINNKKMNRVISTHKPYIERINRILNLDVDGWDLMNDKESNISKTREIIDIYKPNIVCFQNAVIPSEYKNKSSGESNVIKMPTILNQLNIPGYVMYVSRKYKEDTDNIGNMILINVNDKRIEDLKFDILEIPIKDEKTQYFQLVSFTLSDKTINGDRFKMKTLVCNVQFPDNDDWVTHMNYMDSLLEELDRSYSDHLHIIAGNFNRISLEDYSELELILLDKTGIVPMTKIHMDTIVMEALYILEYNDLFGGTRSSVSLKSSSYKAKKTDYVFVKMPDHTNIELSSNSSNIVFTYVSTHIPMISDFVFFN